MFLGLEKTTYQGSVKQEGAAYLTAQARSPLSHWVSCFWQLEVGAGDFVYRSVPDNSIDWIFNLNDSEDSFVVSPYVTPIEFPLVGPVAYFGIRFRILGYQGLVDVPVGDWRSDESSLHASEIVKNETLGRLVDASCCAASFDERCGLVSAVLLRELKYPTIDKRLAKFIRYVSDDDLMALDVNRLGSADFGVSARQLRRLSQLYLGMSLKDFCKVTRFQKVLHMMNTSKLKNAWSNHYYDQSHYIREFKSLSGATPGTFLNMSVLYNRESS